MSRVSNRADKDRKRRSALRKRLRSAGVSEAEIERIIAVKREDDRARRHGEDPRKGTRAEILARTDDSLWPDDTGYKPSAPDSLLTGPARAMGVTAKVSRRRHTITEYQHQRTKGEIE